MVTSSLLTSAFSPLKKKIRDGRIEALWAEMKSEGLGALIVAGRGLHHPIRVSRVRDGLLPAGSSRVCSGHPR